MTQATNADQAEFWASEAGAKWVTMQDSIDAQLTGVLEHLLDLADISPGQSVLDIGCGTGASVLALCARVGQDGSVEGLDIAEQMLARARQRLRDAGTVNARLTLADAQVHRFAPRSFDRAVSRFGVMFFEDPVDALANIAGALRPGGRVTFATWGPLAANPWFSVPREAAIAQLGEVGPFDQDAPGPMAFHDTERVLELFRRAGLQNPRVEVANIPLTPRGDLQAVAKVASNLGPASRIMRTKGGTEDDARAIAARVEVEFEKYVTPEGVRVPTQLNYYSAEVD